MIRLSDLLSASGHGHKTMHIDYGKTPSVRPARSHIF